MGLATGFLSAGEARQDWELTSSFLPLGLTDAHFPRPFTRTDDPDSVTDGRAALLPAELTTRLRPSPLSKCVHSKLVYLN